MNPTLATAATILLATSLLLTTQLANCLSTGGAASSGSSQSDYHQQQQQQQYMSQHQQQQQQQQQQQHSQHVSQVAQPRVGGLEPGDYVDEAGELDVMAGSQQIPTAQLMSAAGHIVPDNFFLPGGSIPALYARYAQHQHQQQHQQAPPPEAMQQVASHVQARHISPAAAVKYARQADLIAAASALAVAGGPIDQHDNSPLIDFNGYNLVAAQQEGRDPSGAQPGAVMDLVEFLGPAGQSAALFEQQQREQQMQYNEQQMAAAEMAAIAANHREQQQQQQQQNQDNTAQSSENLVIGPEHYSASAIGPAYQISGHSQAGELYGGAYDQGRQGGGGYGDKEQDRKPYGLPTKSSSKEPSGMLKPSGNPKTVSSPVIDFVANQLPKTSNLEKLADKLPQHQTPTVFSFSSSKDPMEKVKGVNQKKRNVMRQAEQIAKMMIKTVNDKFGTTIGDQSDIPFLLSSLGPLGLAQNLLFDPTLLVTLLNSAEKTYFSDVLPGTAKMAIRPVLNIFRVPNKKRDKANLLNIISFLASGGQTPSSTPPKHRQGTGVERASKNKNRK